MSTGHILIVEDEGDIRELLRLCVEGGGYRTSTAGGAKEALALLQVEMPDLALLDVNLPDGDGMELCAEIRERSNIPIILVTARKGGEDIVAGLEGGANDYIVKPFDVNVVIARIRAQLRGFAYWKKTYQPYKLISGDLQIDLKSCSVTVGEKEIILSAKERQLLLFLAEHPNQVFSASLLYDRIWGLDGTSEENTVSVHIRYLRKKIESNPSSPRYIQTVRGFGYKLCWTDE
ncbi:DNA-binding response regulator [Paenibacillus pinisoli]|uniref:DNA-binding response regulator n=1 Tax=Paenibacillus pinisoli TaxID=1276110 RepID=A0A3A6PBR0_9BACL|nr:response regulator transcription factor [Paenibacillus pinisoli]RJX37917.1 DNA-binding response regulator [Paenibacillus pinisoli]